MTDVNEPARVVEVVAHDPAWAGCFARQRAALLRALPAALSIEHIGSTSVPGLAAKPIIDILPVVPDVAGAAADPSPLLRLGYVHRPAAFADDDEHLFCIKARP